MSGEAKTKRSIESLSLSELSKKYKIETQEMRILGNPIVEATQTDDLTVLVALSLDILACHTATRLESNCPIPFEKQRFMS